MKILTSLGWLMMATKIHKFEIAQLGRAPYQLLKVEMREQDPEGPKVGTSCDYCATYITNVFFCQSSDGMKFVLGSSCIEKLGDKGLIDQAKAKQREINREKQQAKRQAEWEAASEERRKFQLAYVAEQKLKAVERDVHNLAEYERVIKKIQAQPHPNAFFARKGKTMLDYLTYFWDNPSYSGCNTAAMVRRNWKVTQILVEAGADIWY